MRVLPGTPLPQSLTPQLQGDKRPDRRDRATIRIVTFNDDFTDKKTDLPHIHGGVVMVQEAKNVNVRGEVNQRRYDVFQNREDPAHAGSALYWKHDRFRVTGRGQKLLARADGNDDMLNRHITWSDLKVRGKDVNVRMASAHRPPGDEKDEWAEFDRGLVQFAKQARRDGIPVVIGMDINMRDPKRIRELERKTGLEWHRPPGSIDGFLTSPNIRFNVKPHREKDRFSEGHRPVAASITVFESRPR